MPRTQHQVRLTPDQRQHLETFVASGAAPARAYTRAHILLLADRSGGRRRRYDTEIADALGCSTRTVARVRAEWGARGPDAIHHRPRLVNTPPKLTDEQTVRLLAIATGAPPAGHARWTLRLVARRAVELEITDHLCAETVRATFKKRGCALGPPSAS